MPPSVVYLVSGSNKGIGLGLVTEILGKHDSAVVYAGARDPEKAVALHELKVRYQERITIVRLISGDVEGNAAIAQEIEARHGRMDTVIANAAMGTGFAPVSRVDPTSMDEHFAVNVTGTVILFQAVYKLLKKSAAPRFVTMTSDGGRLDGPGIRHPLGGVTYGASKAALNWVTRKIHFENNWLIAFPLSPGPVSTDLLQHIIDADPTGKFGTFLVETHGGIPSVDEASVKLLQLVDESTRAKEGGEFVHIDGTRLAW